MPFNCAVLSRRLGLGKGGTRMAPEEALGEILQVYAWTVLESLPYLVFPLLFPCYWQFFFSILACTCICSLDFLQPGIGC
jgi:hypothetical protein